MLEDSKVAKAKRQKRKKFIKHLVKHPLPWFILMVAIVYICEAINS